MRKKLTITLIAVLLMAYAMPLIAEELAKVDINAASKEQLMALDGVGESYAERIIEYREKNGKFQRPEDIMHVKGIGEKTFEKIKDKIVVNVKK